LLSATTPSWHRPPDFLTEKPVHCLFVRDFISKYWINSKYQVAEKHPINRCASGRAGAIAPFGKPFGKLAVAAALG
jgi:hypothetical protein